MSQPMPGPDAWKTPEIREAESALDRSISQSRQLLKNLEKIKLPPVKKPDTPERIEALKNAASRPDAPPELRRIRQKVDAGELSWQDVAAGKAFADPEVRELAAGRLGEAKELLDELEDGVPPEELLEARTGSASGGSLLDDRGRSGYGQQPEQSRGYSNESPVYSSSQPDYPSSDGGSEPEPPQTPPAPPRHRAAEQDPDDEFASPLSHRRNRDDSADSDDDFANPIADRDTPPSKPAPPPTPPPSRRKRDDPPDSDDDYFGGGYLR
ncbi:hypothetical protein [Amycolatopsis jiangsuensis]|uniref:Uncharacterized protein n=1 Tax=Amycolatopsis jiangsuensis TaxID=1181879 RepID=A0A840IV56_9PSEU|nr:hypothetical protein [Amycolatopsis jiangsuensis]MBB4685082.1 hypothetical protein [Amycolatopsis jiangsuensis]